MADMSSQLVKTTAQGLSPGGQWLVQQLDAMGGHYRVSCLLIRFDISTNFCILVVGRSHGCHLDLEIQDTVEEQVGERSNR